MLLEIENLSKAYQKGKPVLDKINLTLGTGIIGLLGSNGAGKSTLLNIISTLVRPSSGSIKFQGVDASKTPNVIQRSLGYLPQSFGLYPNLSGFEFLNYMAAVKGVSSADLKQRLEGILELLNLTSVARRPIHTYSGGMRQRIGIAQALVNDPQLLIFDEPTVGLDPEERIRFRELLLQLADKKIILISSHIVSDIELIADKVVFINKGKITGCGSISELTGNLAGNIYETTVSKNQYERFAKAYQMLSVYHVGNNFTIKFASNEPVDEPGVLLLNPSLEDTYLFYNHNNDHN